MSEAAKPGLDPAPDEAMPHDAVDDGGTRDPAIERWLREEVVPTYRRAKAHPETLRPIPEAMDELERRIRERARLTGKA